MRKTAGSLVIALLISALVSVPVEAPAVTFEDSFEDCNYPEMLDLILMRPLSLAATLAGSTVFVGLAPLGLVTVRRDMGTVYDTLVASPARFTFKRKLGECQAVSLDF